MLSIALTTFALTVRDTPTATPALRLRGGGKLHASNRDTSRHTPSATVPSLHYEQKCLGALAANAQAGGQTGRGPPAAESGLRSEAQGQSIPWTKIAGLSSQRVGGSHRPPQGQVSSFPGNRVLFHGNRVLDVGEQTTCSVLPLIL